MDFKQLALVGECFETFIQREPPSSNELGGSLQGSLMGFEPTTSTSTVWRSAIELQAPYLKRAKLYHQIEKVRKIY